MPFWRKKNQDFEWQSYVRTTVLMRRKKRRQQLEEAGAAAAFGVRQARWKSWTYLKAAAHGLHRGGVASGRAIGRGGAASWAYAWPRIKAGAAAARQGSARGATAAVNGLKAGGRSSARGLSIAYKIGIQPALAFLSTHISRWTRPLLDWLGSPQLFGPLCIVAAVTVLGAGVNLANSGLSSDSLLITGLAFALLGLVIAAWPYELNPDSGWANLSLRPWAVGNLKHSTPARVGLAVILLLGVGVAAWQAGASLPRFSSIQKIAMPDLIPEMKLPDINPFKTEVISGRGRAVDGGHIKVGKQLIRLDNIEALLPAQQCKTGRGRSWRCGRRAKSQLQRLISRKTLSCTIAKQDDDAIKRATCQANNKDIAAALVEQGYAFANLGHFADYREEEDKARKNKRGVWQGSAERPSDYRVAQWEQAVERAPNGCPIKGRVVRRKRLYALPWDRGYRRFRMRARRGEKWFCSEKEAIAAGYKHLNQI